MTQADSDPRETFASVLALLDPLTSSSFSEPAVEIAMGRAEQLPPVPCGGFEFSLLKDDGAVDLMQCHTMDDRGAPRLINYLDLDLDGNLSKQPWKWLRNLAANDRDGIANIWLEFDAESERSTPPSIFLEFDRRRDVSPSRIYELLETMPLANVEAQKAALIRIAEALPAQSHISHLGAMFSRSDTPLRVNVKRLKSDQLEPFTSRIGLGVCPDEAKMLLERAYRSTICLDVIESILPRLGVEFSFSGWPAREEGWFELSTLVAEGRIQDNQWEALRSWAYAISPIEAVDYWPSSCILDELAHPRPASSIIECGPSHIKATYTLGQQPTLKAYVGFRPSFREEDGNITAGDMPISPPRPEAKSFGDVIERGVDFLLEERTQDGLWRDFDFANLASDEWVSGYIGAHLLELDQPATQSAAAAIWPILCRRRVMGEGWGYHRLTQPDADSTAWVLILAQRLGLDSDPMVEANMEFLRGHLDENGGAVTYSGKLLDRIDQPLPKSEAHDEWHGQHGEVTASAAMAGLDEAIENLLQTQQSCGSWNAFWIASDAYSTGLACEALSRIAKQQAKLAISKAARWALEGLSGEDLGVFNQSWLIRAAFCDKEARKDPRLADAVRSLASRQLLDGSWTGDCALVIPIMDDAQSASKTIEAPDIHRNFTTATALVAIEKARKIGAAWRAA